MKKVLFVATVTNHIKTFHIPYLKIFKEKKYEVHVASKGNKKIEYCDKHYDIQFERNPIKLNNIKAYKELKRIINENNYEIIHCHTPVGGVLTRLAARKARKSGTKVIYTAHGFHFYKGAPLLNWLMYYPIEKWLSKYTDCLITINQEDYERAKRKFKKCKQIELVHGVGINENKFKFEITPKEKHELRLSLGIKDNDFVLIQIGELNRNKNQIMAINAMKNLTKKIPNIHLLIVGKGQQEEYYKAKINEYNLKNNIHMLGYREDIPQLLKISNVLLSLSYREGLPVNVMEAMASDLPVIATDCRGNRDLIDNVNTININDIQKLEKNIFKFYNNEKNIYSYSMEKYLKENIREKMEKIYNDISNKKIIHLLASNKFSGAENVVCQIFKMLEKNNSVEMMYVSVKGSIQETVEKRGIKYLGLDKLNYRNVKEIVREYNPDIIHAHDVSASVLAALNKKKNIKIISHMHVNNINMSKINFKTIVYLISAICFSHIFWVSKSSLEGYIFKKYVKNKSSVLFNVINKENVHNRAKIADIQESNDIIYVGRLEYQKNPEKLIRILEKLKVMNKDFKAAIVGDGQLYNDTVDKIKEKHLEENIRMYGFVTNPLGLINNSKVLILASRFEGTPMCALEAMALGKPIVSTPTDGMKDLITDNENGFLEENDMEFAKKINSLITNNELNNKFSTKTIQKFDDTMNIQEYCNTILNYYREK